MSVETQHPSYSDKIADNQLIRDVLDGDKSVKARGETYVPKLSGQDNTAYLSYLNRAEFSNYIARIHSGLIGLVFAKQPTQTIPTQLKEILEDVTLSGQSFYDLSKSAIGENIAVGRAGYLIDVTSNTEDEDGFSSRPYASEYKTETIINWKYSSVDNQQVLSLVVLQETEDNWTDLFTNEIDTIYRVLQIDENGNYTQTVYRNGDGGYVAGEIVTPMMNGAPLKYIPFYGVTPSKATVEPEKSPLYDIAVINIGYFKLDVDLHHGLHFTALPTPYGSGIQMQDDAAINVGATTFQVFPDPQAKLDFLEFEGTGLKAISDKMDKKEQTIAVLGSRMLETQKKAAESFDTTSSRTSGERAVLVSLTDTTSKVLLNILQTLADWSGVTGEIKYELNTDYNLTEMSMDDVVKLGEAKAMGTLSENDVFYNLKQGERVPEDKTLEEHKVEIETQTPDLTVSPITAPSTTKDTTTLQAIREKLGL